MLANKTTGSGSSRNNGDAPTTGLKDLKGDLKRALGDFDFKGNHAFFGPLPLAPSPGLQIEGIGPVGLPLTERDAKLIAGSATQAPSGTKKGKKGVSAQSGVCDAFAIRSSKVKFENPDWKSFIENKVAESARTALGVGLSTAAPRCEFHSLLLYPTGSRITARKNTGNASGVFATILVVLPCRHSGGQLHISHGPAKKSFDLASSSTFNTSFISWYTDVTLEVEPITSGYRLALSYNLFHSSSGPKPSLPNMSTATLQLRSILQGWLKGAYRGSKGCTDIVGYLLQHNYHSFQLKMGGLNGKDAHLLTNMRSVAEEEGFMVGLANLEYRVTGTSARGIGGYGGYGRGSRYSGYYDSDDDDDYGLYGDYDDDGSELVEVLDSSLTVTDLKDLDGNSLMGTADLGLTNENLIPENPFRLTEPDEIDDDGGMGCGTIAHVYNRTLLVLFHRSKEGDILLKAGGVAYALKKLESAKTREPTEEDKMLARYVVERINTKEKLVTQAMAGVAVQWGDLSMWNQITKAGAADKGLDILGEDQIAAAWKKFSFGVVQPMLETILGNTNGFKVRLGLINSLSQKASGQDKKTLRSWVDSQTSLALLSLKDVEKEDVPVLMPLVLSRGPTFLSECILPQLDKLPSTFDFLVDFILALNAEKQQLLKPSKKKKTTSINTTADNDFNGVLQRCLDSVVNQWDSVTTYSYGMIYGVPGPDTAKTSRIIQLAELCLSIERQELCGHILGLVISSKGKSSEKLPRLYKPLVSELKQMLARKSIDISTDPFCAFMQAIIRVYLNEILGEKPLAKVPQMRRIGCGCSDCSSVNAFMSSNKEKEEFRWVQNRRKHIETQLNKAPDLVTHSTVRAGSPHTLVVTKNQAIISAVRWVTRKKAAQAFMAEIGDEGTIAKIMGKQYNDVVRAIEGTQLFPAAAKPNAQPAVQSAHAVAPGRPPTNVVNVSTPNTASVPQASIASSSTLPTTSTQAPGQKRKRN